MKQSTNLPDILCDLYQYNERLKTEFLHEVESEAAELGRKPCADRKFILIECLRTGRGDKVRGTLLQMLCDELGLDPEKEERALQALPGKLPDAKQPGADRPWCTVVCEVSGTSREETLKLIGNAKPYKTSGARRRKTIDKLLEDTAAEYTDHLQSVRDGTLGLADLNNDVLKLFQDYEEPAKGNVRERHSKTQTPHEKSLAWLSAVEWLGERVSPSIENVETNLEWYCHRPMVGRDGNRSRARMSHRLWQKKQNDQSVRLLQTEITRLDTPENVDELLRLLWIRWPNEARQTPLPKLPTSWTQRPDAGGKLKSEAKQELVRQYLDECGGWDGTLEELSEALKKEKGLKVSPSTLSRYLRGTKYDRHGKPHRAAKGKGQREPVSGENGRADLSHLDAWSMPDDAEDSIS